MTPEELQKQVEVRALLVDRVIKSVRSASSDETTVQSPAQAADYVANALTKDPKGRELLALVTATFARDEVERLLAEMPTRRP